MQKIIAAFDGLKFSDSTSDYAIELSKKSKSHLVGIFLDDRTYTSYKIYDLVLDQGVSEKRLHSFKEKDINKRSISANKFDLACRTSAIEYNIHHDRNVALQDLLHETIFADYLILNFTETFSHYEEKSPSRFVKDVLSNTQCPILLVPKEHKDVEKIIFLYDAQPTSVYAIKMFAYLLSFYHNLPIEVVCTRSIEENLHLPHNALLKELLKRHYKDISFTVLKGIPEVEIINHLKNEKKNILAVLGAYRRTMLSRWFKSSLADAIINELKIPLFIAHNK